MFPTNQYHSTELLYNAGAHVKLRALFYVFFVSSAHCYTLEESIQITALFMFWKNLYYRHENYEVYSLVSMTKDLS